MKTKATLITALAFLAGGPLVLADFPAVVTADDPLVYYQFEEDPGATTLADSSGNGLAIDYSFPIGTTVLGLEAGVGKGALFNGDGSILTPLVLDPTLGDFTIEAVLRPGEGTGDGVVVANLDGTTGPGRSQLVVNGAEVYTTFSGGATTSSGVQASTDLFDHVILTYDQSASVAGGVPTFRFYVNGEAAGTSEIVPEPADGNWVIGSNKNQTVQFFTGILDELVVYDKRLDDPDGDGDPADSRISAHYLEFLADSDTLINFNTDFAYRDSGQSAELSWFVSPALTSLTLDNGSGPVDVLDETTDGLGSISVSPTATTTYTLTGTGSVGTESLQVEITVDEPAVIESFTANSSELPKGGNAILSWVVSNGTTVEIDNGVGTVDPIAGSVEVTVEDDTTYTLSATNSQGTETAQLSITTSAFSDPTLVAHWRVGETAGETEGTTLVSETGEAFAGIFVGTPAFDTADPAPVPGGSTASLVFDGFGSWVEATGYTGVGASAARTVAFWFKGPADQNNTNANFVGWGTGATGERFDIRIHSAGVGQIRTEVAGSGSNGTVPVADDTWHHCAVVLDPTVGTTIGDILFYIDGELDPLTGVGVTPINTTTTNPVRIGTSNSFPGRALTGKMDDIRIYERALTAAEIAVLAEPGAAQALQITAIRRLANGNVEIDWTGTPGEYFFEYSVDLVDGSWREISDSEVIEVGETTATSIDNFVAPGNTNPKVFYRLRASE